jgi:hypothetical protein
VDWWVSTAAVVDEMSVQLSCTWSWLGYYVRSVPASEAVSLDVWGALLGEAVEMVKLNHVARLSAADTMSFMPVRFSIIAVQAATKIESQKSVMMSAGVVDALEFACVHSFTIVDLPLASYAAAAVLELVGRNEDGKTLSRETVFALLSKYALWFDETSFASELPPSKLHKFVADVATMAVSDANKRLMLEFDGLPSVLQKSLLVGSPRRAEEGAGAAQEAAAGLILSLSLFEPWGEVLRAKSSGVVVGLHGVLKDGSATERAVRSAEQALFELEGRGVHGPEPTAAAAAAAASSSAAVKHVMVSYCWDQQPVVKRVHAALVRRGYTVWIDIEQMTGSTVDAMALAVENACVVLIGVSREYKESTNCRLEAQYAMQREVPVIPLMLEDGYRADGWLGILIGTRMWYGFFGAVCSEEAQFEGKVSELCRDLGVRGMQGHRGRSTAALSTAVSRDITRMASKRIDDGCGDADATSTASALVGARLGAGANSADGSHDAEPPEKLRVLRGELGSMKLSALKQRAKEVGVNEDRLAEADDAEDVKSTVIELIVEKLEQECQVLGGANSADGSHDAEPPEKLRVLRGELGSMKLSALKQRANEVGVNEDRLAEADDAEDVKSTVIELIVEMLLDS